MGQEANLKALRKQLRTVVKELVPEVLKTELTLAISKQLSEDLGKRMDFIAKNAKETLDKMSGSQKDFQNLIMRQLAPPAAEVPPVQLTETPPTETL